MDLSQIINELGEERENYFNAVAPPIIQTSNFAFKEVSKLREAIADEFPVNLYSRGNNPTVSILRKKLAALDGAEDALVLSSGAAAIFLAVFANVTQGDHIVCVSKPYSWTDRLMNSLLPRFGVNATMIDGTRIENFVADYLLKPISFERFLKAVNKVADQRKNLQEETANAEYMFVKVDSKLVKVNFSEINYIEGMKDYLKIFVKERPLVVHQTMKRIEDILPKSRFIRVHKSYIVSLSAVNTIVGNMVEINGKEIPIGANYKEQLIKLVFKQNN